MLKELKIRPLFLAFMALGLASCIQERDLSGGNGSDTLDTP
jgi:hypothetical protein